MYGSSGVRLHTGRISAESASASGEIYSYPVVHVTVPGVKDTAIIPVVNDPNQEQRGLGDAYDATCLL